MVSGPRTLLVMAGLVPAIHVCEAGKKEGVDARDKPGHDGGKSGSYDRVASTTPASVNTSATIWISPSGSPSAIAEATTPITGTAMVPIAATDAGSRARAANQLT